MKVNPTLLVLLRFSLAWVMLWAFLDKLFGFGYDTTPGQAWLDGVNPTEGFLIHATQGPLAGLFQSMAVSPVVTWLFMLGLGLVGLSLFIGVGIRIAGVSGATMMILMWLATLTPEHNPFMDEHIVYAICFLIVGFSGTGHHYGFGKRWTRLKWIKKRSWLH